jgi:hypothetical protein
MDNTDIIDQNTGALELRDELLDFDVRLHCQATREQKMVVGAVMESAASIMVRMLEGKRALRLKMVLPLHDRLEGLVVLQDAAIDLGISHDPFDCLYGQGPEVDREGNIEFDLEFQSI